MEFVAEVKVWLRHGIADPEGLTIAEAISSLGHQGIRSVNSGKVFRLVLEADNIEVAEEKVAELAQTLLSNPVLEDHQTSIHPANRVDR